jgi:ATP-dependent Zn protease
MVAEEIFFGEPTTGPSSDLTYATTAAAMMVGSLGMYGSLISYDAVQGPGGGGGNLASKVLSTEDGKDKIERILFEAKTGVTAMLEDYRHIVEALRDALLERDELIGDEILATIRQAETHQIALN